ncbi:MAG: hypothetical protein QE484_19235 [Rhizobium sp.]|nr:hypothetical protein [Rhizobium sp.]
MLKGFLDLKQTVLHIVIGPDIEEGLLQASLEQSVEPGSVVDLGGQQLCLQAVEHVVVHAILDATFYNSRLCLDVSLFAIEELYGMRAFARFGWGQPKKVRPDCIGG